MTLTHYTSCWWPETGTAEGMILIILPITLNIPGKGDQSLQDLKGSNCTFLEEILENLHQSKERYNMASSILN